MSVSSVKNEKSHPTKRMEKDQPRKQPVIFCLGGTSEGRALADTNIPLVYSTLTQSGCERISEREGLICRFGALPYPELAECFGCQQVVGVVDATHPYASSISYHALQAARAAQKPICRFTRKPNDQELQKLQVQHPGVITVVENELSAAQWIKDHIERNNKVLMATGAFHLSAYKDAGLIDQLVVRMLDGPESLQKATELGLTPDQLILGRGPYSYEQNCEHIALSQADVLVTKESGSTGGFLDKIQAALTWGISVLVIDRPKEDAGAYDLYAHECDEVYHWCHELLRKRESVSEEACLKEIKEELKQ